MQANIWMRVTLTGKASCHECMIRLGGQPPGKWAAYSNSANRLSARIRYYTNSFAQDCFSLLPCPTIAQLCLCRELYQPKSAPLSSCLWYSGSQVGTCAPTSVNPFHWFPAQSKFVDAHIMCHESVHHKTALIIHIIVSKHLLTDLNNHMYVFLFCFIVDRLVYTSAKPHSGSWKRLVTWKTVSHDWADMVYNQCIQYGIGPAIVQHC